jgi:hypothetical protein
LTGDSWQGDQNQPMSYNSWLYVYANPVNHIDPNGMKAIFSWPLYQNLLNYIYIFDYNAPAESIDILHGDETNKNGERMLSPKAMELIASNFQSDPADVTPYNPITYIYNYTCKTWMEGDKNYRGEYYNRYDWIFSGWVDYFTWRAKAENNEYFATDPNLFKALAWKETNLGVGGDPSQGVALLSYEEIRNLKGIFLASNDKYYQEMYWGLIDIQQKTDPIQNIGGLIRLLNAKYIEYRNLHISEGKPVDSKSVWISALHAYGPHSNAPDYLDTYGEDVYNFYETGTYKNNIYVFGNPPPGFNR